MSELSTSMLAVFADRVASDGGQPAIQVADDEGHFHNRSWQQLADDVYWWTSALHRQNIRPGDRVALWAENSYEWIVADMAIAAVRAVHVPLHGTLTPHQAGRQVQHSGATLLLTDDLDITSLRPHFGNVPIRTFHASCGPTFRVAKRRPRWMRWFRGDDRGYDQTSSLGVPPSGGGAAMNSVPAKAPTMDRFNLDEGKQLVSQAIAATQAGEIATVLYSSGTTAEPKGIALTNANLVSNTFATLDAFGEQPSDVRAVFLPFSHIYARTCDLYTWIARGSQLALVRRRETIAEDVRAIGPTLINGVPYYFQRVQRRVAESGAADQSAALKAALGGNIRACCCGGAACPVDTFQFFHDRGVKLLPGYGLTETSPVISLSNLDEFKAGTSGKPIPGVEVRIADDGEILTRGPHLMAGYWQDEVATANIIRDGWLHTGDLGSIDEDGFLTITGRKREMIVLATGKNIFPQTIEDRLCRDSLIHQAIVVGDGQKYLAALIVPEKDALIARMKTDHIVALSKKSAVANKRVRAIYREILNCQLGGLPKHEQVAEFAILDRGFTIEGGHLTPKASLRRRDIERDFCEEIAGLFRSR